MVGCCGHERHHAGATRGVFTCIYMCLPASWPGPLDAAEVPGWCRVLALFLNFAVAWHWAERPEVGKARRWKSLQRRSEDGEPTKLEHLQAGWHVLEGTLRKDRGASGGEPSDCLK